MSTIIISLLIFGVLIIVHEFGHFSVAKLIGVKVEEFAVGMGPKIVAFQKGETLYTLRALPLGGFCSMLGEDQKSDDERSLNNKSRLERAAVFAAGSIMNIILAIILLSIVLYFIGIPTTIIDEVQKEYPAYQAGIQPGDKIISINNQKIKTYNEIQEIINNNKNKALNITIQRNNKTKNIMVTPKYDKNLDRYRIGISPGYERSVTRAVISSFEESIFLTKSILEVLGQLLIGKGNLNNLTGPVGVIAVVNETAKIGILPVLLLTSQISLNLGIFNLLPIPALDGSRLLFLIIEVLRGKPLSPEKEGLFHFVGLMLLMVFAIFIAYRDVVRFF
ncbi:RIP metalloprotease RseP [Garciella nitratireducens]|uniref:Zinc metalloprotease n=1 Tax=Garciella nitratireducens DSM 15102 TaxID=1121911 RepID=A0A1T4JX36_9FIRM|nr:RIP metalloprotease RseP [Garciella nitratireducens]SJZ34657.1 regulator of sigma E protease [Garciella nitratireducens DSM 15102]